MAHYNVEVLGDSRRIKSTRTGMSETFAVQFCLDDGVAPVATNAEFTGTGDAIATPGSWNASDDVVALEYAYSIFPLLRYLPDNQGNEKILILVDISLENPHGRTWKAVANYSFDINKGSGGQQASGGTLPYVKLGFRIGGGTRKITKSLEEVGAAVLRTGSPLPGIPPNKQAIGTTENGDIQGTNVPGGGFKVQITGYFEPATITLPYMITVMKVIRGSKGTGSYNNAPYLGGAVGEVQVQAVSGGASVNDIIPLTFEFALEPNVTDVEDTGFANLTMLGHDRVVYDFFKIADPTGSKKMITSPEVRRVHRVHTPENYGLLKLPFNQLSP